MNENRETLLPSLASSLDKLDLDRADQSDLISSGLLLITPPRIYSVLLLAFVLLVNNISPSGDHLKRKFQLVLLYAIPLDLQPNYHGY